MVHMGGVSGMEIFEEGWVSMEDRPGGWSRWFEVDYGGAVLIYVRGTVSTMF